MQVERERQSADTASDDRNVHVRGALPCGLPRLWRELRQARISHAICHTAVLVRGSKRRNSLLRSMCINFRHPDEMSGRIAALATLQKSDDARVCAEVLLGTR
jgi:hypothetical protein